MALITPEFLQTKTYAASKLRMAFRDAVMQEGIIDVGDFKVAQRAAGANMSVDIAIGEALVQGDFSVRQGIYHVMNDAVINATIAANSSGNPRIDQVILRVYDSTDGGGQGTDVPAIEVVQGTPTAGATLANRSGAGAVPATALRLADVLVANGAASILNASIGNPKDPRIGSSGYPAGSLSSVTAAPPQYAFGRPIGYVPSTRAWRDVDVSIVDATDTVVALNSEAGAQNWDTDGSHTTGGSNSRLTCLTPGFYKVEANAQFAASTAAGSREAAILLNGTNVLASDRDVFGGTASSANAKLSVGTAARLGYGDYVELQVRQATGAALVLQSVADQSPILDFVWVGP